MDAYRKQIDEIDEKIVELLNERIKFALEIGNEKGKTDGEVYVPAREREVLKRVTDINKGPIQQESITAIYREIMSASLAMEKNTTIAYLGPSATFTHQAARARFGASVEYVACETIRDVFSAVEKRTTNYGVIPIENSTEGAVTHTLDTFAQTPLKICAEIILPISHHLMALEDKSALKRVYSNPQVFGQCRGWLHANLPGVDLIPISSTAKAAEKAAQDKEVGALASDLAAELYELNILNRDIQDLGGNTTRFLVVGKEYGAPTSDDRTSIFFSVKHDVGALYDALAAFRKHDLNMSKIESRPNKSKAWEYFFFIDFEGHVSDANVQEALKELEEHCTVLTVLGSYPKALAPQK